MKKIVIFGGIIILLLVAGFFLFQSFSQENKEQEEASSTKVSEATTTAISTTEPEKIRTEKLLESMSLEEKVGQLFFVRVPESNQVEDIQSYHLGGYVLFGRDTENETADSLKQKIQSYQEASEIPLLIGADEEGGTVTRISRNSNLVASPFLSPQELYAQGGWDAITQDVQDKAAIFKNYGIQTGLFPVADVSTDPQSFIYDRTIGMDAEGTSHYVETAVTAMKAAGIGSTMKHFPGYGDNRDSHVEIVTDQRPLEDLRKNDFLPFQAGIKAGADSVLVSHNIIASIDPDHPASISKEVHKLLRQELNFQGVVMTDDMDMAGLANFISQEEAGLAALQAGNDLVMSSTYAQQIPVIIQAVKDGTYSESALDQSVMRVLKWKESLGLLSESSK
ncbi:glycoside hydrolase family 3 protein [Enterococcus sp. JM9B]|uniref:glycoside hydrolase family 3 protein n=1 Tax=Enterococcus sp. JM9B TaxID=1857216 RepID=UPI0013752946|nr:glycoside hydrolase family 3 N-terminal domain-containing protein [Enterococcus sp. JM9B]KAF1303539.1 beta-hexosaminidase [Enterococcus sp. JM9B]